MLLVVCLLFEIALKRLFFQQFVSFKCSFHLCICGQIGQTTAEKQTAWSYFGEIIFPSAQSGHRKTGANLLEIGETVTSISSGKYFLEWHSFSSYFDLPRILTTNSIDKIN